MRDWGMKLSKLFLVIACLGLVACGKEEAKPQPVVLVESQQEVNEPVVFTDGLECSSRVIADQRAFRLACNKYSNRKEAWACKSTTQDLLAKYPNLYCKLPPNRSGRIHFFQERELLDAMKVLRRFGW